MLRRHLGVLALVVGLLAAGCRVMPGQSPSPASPPTSAPPVDASPSASVDPVSAFFDAFATEPPPYHVLMGVAISGLSRGSARIEGDVDGADYRADVRVEIDGLPPRDSRIVFLDDTAYLAESDGDDWVAVPGYRSTPPLNPFLALEPADFSDLGPDPDHAGLRHLRSTTWVEEDATLGLAEGGVSEVSFDLWLGAAGAPVEGLLEFVLAGTDPDGQQVDLRYSTHYTFSAVGEEIVIEAPTS